VSAYNFKRRRHRRPTDAFASLRSALLAGGGYVGVFDAASAGDSVTGGLYDSVPDVQGTLQSLVQTSTARPAQTGTTTADKKWSTNGSSTWLESAAADSGLATTLDGSSRHTYKLWAVYVGVLNSAGGYSLMIQDPTGITRYMGLDTRSTNVRSNITGTFIDTGLAKSAELGVYVFGVDGSNVGSLSTVTSPSYGCARLGTLRQYGQNAGAYGTGNQRIVIGRLGSNAGSFATTAGCLVFIFNVQPTRAQLQLIGDYAVAYRSATIPTTKKGAVFIGDSRTVGAEASAGQDYPTLLMAAGGGATYSGVGKLNLGISSRTAAVMSSQIPSMALPSLDPYLAKIGVCFMGGFNDFLTTSGTAAAQAATVYAQIVACCNQIKGLYPNTKIAVGTIFRGNSVAGNAEAGRILLNAQLLSEHGGGGSGSTPSSYADYCADIATDTDTTVSNPLWDFTNATYFFQTTQVHLTGTGNQIVANRWQPVLTAMLA
jgi:hypothetical protein